MATTFPAEVTLMATGVEKVDTGLTVTTLVEVNVCVFADSVYREMDGIIRKNKRSIDDQLFV